MNHCDSGPASRPTRSIASGSPVKYRASSPGSLPTFASLTVRPAASTTQRLDRSSDTSMPTKWFMATSRASGSAGPTLTWTARLGRDRPSWPPRRNGPIRHLFAGSDGGARHWAIVASLVTTAKLNGGEPLAWLTDVLERMVSGRTKAHELERLLPWTWKAAQLAAAVHA
jgi:IS66 C-terminal element